MARDGPHDVIVDPIVLTGRAHPDLARAVAAELGSRLGSIIWETFPDTEISVDVREPVRRRDVIVIHPTQPPVNQHLIELLALADACRRAGAERIIAVIPYFGYARSDRRSARQEPIMGGLAARMIESAGVDHVVTVDPHAPQIEGFFTIPMENVSAVPVLAAALQPILPLDVAVVAPDAGAVRLAMRYADLLGAELIVLHERRDGLIHKSAMRVVGDVRGRATLIVDDMISTGQTIVRTAVALLEAGAGEDITVAATHGLLMGEARQRLDSCAVRRIFVTDSTRHRESAWMKLRIVSIASLLADTLRRLIPTEPVTREERGALEVLL